MHQRWFRALFRRRMIMILLLILQVVFLVHLIFSGSQTFRLLSTGLTILSLLVALYIVSKKDKGAYKTMWVFLIMGLPLFGGLLYLLFTFQNSTRHFAKNIHSAEEKGCRALSTAGGWLYRSERTIRRSFPPNTLSAGLHGISDLRTLVTKYLSPGEKMHEELLLQLKKAEKYIFLEFFIVQEGVMWNSILDILKEKVRQGVKVRLIYDDMGCFFLLPNDYPKQLAKDGIECAIFNPFRPFLTAKQNNRDHRKIVSIDGKIAFTGGINLADEYINVIEKHGHWKDASIMIQGKAAWSFTLMFLEMWEICTGCNEHYTIYYPWHDDSCNILSDGFVQPYADSPMDTENVGEHVYLQILNQAQDYVYINTPYLIVDDSMVSALSLTAKRGVDVRIVTPHKWDKWIVHMTTRSYYRELLKAGVKIYEYTNGFIHAKTFVSDDRTATVGTTNLDFRSLYLHFECGALLFDSAAVAEVKEDFLNTLETCQQITEKDCSYNVVMRLLQDIFRLFAPLM